MQLPDLDGIALTERIRTFTDAKKRSVPVVLQSAFISEAIRQRSEAVGIVDYLLKPVEREDLAALLEKYHSGLVG
jgi:CheY-like chemotaxis protein